MADKNERNRVDNDAGEAVGTGVGAVAEAALGSVLGPLVFIIQINDFN
ncbi:hypothetical protein KW850_29825 [Bacillus sp. sid0103]|nr:hypothetical protein [Bacillus sp. sid0103]MBV7509376.1 hypothetical protein [Bacillus sp. sid0103]